MWPVPDPHRAGWTDCSSMWGRAFPFPLLMDLGGGVGGHALVPGPWSLVPGPCGQSVCVTLRTLRGGFQSGYAVLCSRPQWPRVPIASHSPQRWAVSYCRHHSRCDTVSRCVKRGCWLGCTSQKATGTPGQKVFQRNDFKDVYSVNGLVQFGTCAHSQNNGHVRPAGSSVTPPAPPRSPWSWRRHGDVTVQQLGLSETL